MSGLGSLLLFCAWASGLVAAYLTIRSFDEPVRPAGARQPVPIALAGALVVALGLPWTTTPNGQFTSSGWMALDAATVVAVLLLASGVAALAALPDRGGPRRDLHALVLSLSLFGIVAGNWLIAMSGGWGETVRWGATLTLALAAALATTQALPFVRALAPRRPDDPVDLTAELPRLDDLRAY